MLELVTVRAIAMTVIATADYPNYGVTTWIGRKLVKARSSVPFNPAGVRLTLLTVIGKPHCARR